MTTISIIAAMAENRVIGNGNKLPSWRAPGDLKRFKKLTTGKVVIMGRKTFESMGSQPLPNRTNIIVSSNPDLLLPRSFEVFKAASLNEAIQKSKAIIYEDLCNSARTEIMVIGGAQIYEQALPLASRIYLTLVKGEYPGDVFFPSSFDPKEFELVEEEVLETHSYLIYER